MLSICWHGPRSWCFQRRSLLLLLKFLVISHVHGFAWYELVRWANWLRLMAMFFFQLHVFAVVRSVVITAVAAAVTPLWWAKSRKKKETENNWIDFDDSRHEENGKNINRSYWNQKYYFWVETAEKQNEPRCTLNSKFVEPTWLDFHDVEDGEELQSIFRCEYPAHIRNAGRMLHTEYTKQLLKA